uniref:YSIRK-type signal peptide-containing protein n=1 Tax=Streptococcus pseudopneumoniae TaxID=257758 RepID=UPI00066E2230
MEHKNPMSRVERLHREKVTRYSIRKYSFGAASVAVAALFMFLGNGAVSVQADEIQGNRVTESPKPQPEEDKSKPATEVAPVLNKTQLESYISEIETKLSNGSYDNKTEESVAVLKADLEAAKTTLANATTQAELKQAYSKLVTTVNSKLKNKPVEKKETPTVDTTEGKETVGKKAENTEPKSESNSIENTGSNDPRNEKAIPTGIQFRAEIAYSTNEETNENGKKNDYITSGVGGSTSSEAAQRLAPRILNYRTRFNKDENGKITSVDWMVYYNNYAENLSNTYGMRGELYRNYIQIPKEVNMPENIERLQYAVPNKPVFQGGKPVWPRPNGNSLYNEVTFDDPAPKSAVGIPLKTNVSFTKDKWPSTRSGRGYDTLAGKESDYFKDAAKTSGAKELVYADALTEEHVIWDQSNTGGDAQDAYVWKFTTTVPKTTTNEQLKNMKAVMGMFRVGTAGVDHGVHTIATNPVNVTDADVANPQPKPQPKPETSQLGVNNTYTQTNDTITVPTIASTDTVLTGTGTPGARINIKDGGKVVNNTTIVGENGQWTFPITTGLNSNVTGGKQLVDKSQISVSQTVNGVESADVPVNVSLGYSEIEPSSNSKEKNNLVENDRNVTLKVPHDAGAAYFKFTDPDGNVQTVELTRDSVPKRAGVPGNWQVTNSELASVTSSDQGDHYSTINLTLKKDMKAETTAEVVSNMQKGSYTSLQGWQSRDVEAAPKPQPETPVVAPTVEIPYSDPAPNKKEVYLYTGEDADVDITFNDDSGKIKSASLRKGGNQALNNIDGNPDKQDNEFGYTVTAINSETATPATIKVTGRVSGLDESRLPKTENDSLELVTRFATATDTDGAEISNTAVKNKNSAGEIVGSYLTDPGAVTFVLKAQTKKYDIKTPASADKVTVSNANNVTDKEFEKIKEKVKVEYSQNNPDARLADKKGQEVEDASKVVDKVEKEGNNVVVTYKDGSKDTKPLSEFVNVAPTVELPYSNKDKKEIYVYTGENTDLTFKGSDEAEVKNLYLRGPGDTTWNNAAGYGLPTGKVENGAVTGEGSVSGDKKTATIKMTGVTNLKAGQKWTSFVVAEDNNDAKSTTDFRALDKNPNATQTPGYVLFIVKSQTDKYDIATPAPADKVEVADPAKVTDAELDKIKEKLQLEYNKKNDDANIAKNTAVDKDGKIKSVTKDDKGNLVVTYTDGSTDTKPLSEFVTKKPTTPAKDADGVKDPAKTPVKDPANLTDAEKA